MPPKVISSKKASLKKLGYDSLEQWLQNPNHVYIGRDMTFYVKGAVGSKWQNPFPTKKYELGESLRLFEEYLMSDTKLLADIHELKGKDLACWCKNGEKSDERCHGDLLLKLANKEVITSFLL